MPVYVVESNFFIQAHRASYPLDIAESFWKLVKKLAEKNSIISIDKVRDEIRNNDDELTEWIDLNLPETFFEETKREDIINEYSRLASWAELKSVHYKRGAIDEFLEYDKADAWLVAYCMVTGDTVVTQEISDPNQKNRIKIPDVCDAFDVNYCNMIEMFRKLQVRF